MKKQIFLHQITNFTHSHLHLKYELFVCLILSFFCSCAGLAHNPKSSFYNPGDHFKTLIDTDKVLDAVMVYENNLDYFTKNSANYEREISIAANAANKRFDGDIRHINKYIGKLPDCINKSGWKDVRYTIIESKRILSDYNRFILLKDKYSVFDNLILSHRDTRILSHPGPRF